MTVQAFPDRRLRRLQAKWDQAPSVGWRQLCAIVRVAYLPDAGDWAERVKRDLARLGFRYEPDLVARALRAVDRLIGRPLPTSAKPSPAAVTPAVRGLSPKEGAALLAEIRRRVVARSTP